MGLRREAVVVRDDLELTDLAGGFVVRGPGKESPYPSANQNRAEFVGCGEAIAEGDFLTVVDHFDRGGVDRWFFWLSPCAQMEEIRTWLTAAGMKRFGGTGYPTLVYPGGAISDHDTTLTIVSVGVEDLERHSEFVKDLYGPYVDHLTSMAGREGFRVYLALDDGEPVAAAGLGTHEGAGGL